MIEGNERFKVLVMVCVILALCISSCAIVFADTSTSSAIQNDEDNESIFNTDYSNDNVTVIVDNTGLGKEFNNLASAILDSNNNDNYEGSFELKSVNVSRETISSNDTNGFKSVVLGLLGDYETIITDYTYQSQQGYTQHSIDITPDWSWIGTCALFLVIIYCFFRMVGGFLCKTW